MQVPLPEGADVTNVVAADGLSRRFRALLAAAGIDVSFTVKLEVGTDGVTTADGTFTHLISALNSAVTDGSFETALKNQIPEITELDEFKFEAPEGYKIGVVNAATCGDKVCVITYRI